jgi:hypothetical protein
MSCLPLNFYTELLKRDRTGCFTVWLAQLVKALAAYACSQAHKVVGSIPGADGLTLATILSGPVK